MAVEFGILAIPFFLVVFFILEVSIIFMGEISMENAVAKTARLVRVGTPEARQEQFVRSELCSRMNILFDCDRIRFDLRPYADFSSIPAKAPVVDGALDDQGFGFDAGEPEDIMSLRVYYAWPITTDLVRRMVSPLGGGYHLIAGQAIFRNEPY